jgi:hypothetical protein
MLQPKDKDKQLILHGFLIGAELVEDSTATPEAVEAKLLDSLAYLEGVGKTDCEHLGVIDTVEVDAEGNPIEKELNATDS